MKYKKPCAVMLAVLYASSLSTPGILRDAITAQVEAAEAEGDSIQGELSVNTYGGYTLTITGSGAMEDYSSASDVPWLKELTPMQVTEVTAVVISQDITYIGANAFSGLTGLTTVTGGTVSIGDNAFANCTSLENVNLDITTASVNAFSNCTTLDDKGFTYKVVNNEKITDTIIYSIEVIKPSTGEARLTVSGTGSMLEGERKRTEMPWWDYRSNIVKVVFEKGITHVPTRAFDAEYKNLRSVTLPESLVSIGDYAFAICEGLTGEFKIPEGVTSLGLGVFTKSNISEVHLPAGVTKLEYRLFDDCPNLTTVTMSDNVTVIDDSAFSSCTALESITLPATLTTIGDNMFSGCTQLKSISIPNSVTSIGSYAFSGCTQLEPVSIPNSVTSIGSYAFQGCTAFESFTWPASLTSIGDYMFYGCTQLKSIAIPDSVTSIGSYAFMNCYALESFVCPAALTSIGYETFWNCNALKSVTFSDSLTSIGRWAFDNCTSLQTVDNLPANVSIGGYAFSGCTLLETGNTYKSGDLNADGTIGYKLVITKRDDLSMELTITGEGDMPDFADKSAPWYSNRNNIKSIVFDDNITYISKNAFSDCGALTNVTLPASLTEAGENAFSGCTKLTSVTFTEENTKTIADYAFSKCINLQTVNNLPANVLFGSNVFNECTFLANGNTYKSGYLDDDATISYELVITNQDDLSMELTITGSGDMPDFADKSAPWYSNRNNIKSIVFDGGITSISENAFSDCGALTSVTLPESLTSIGENAFSGCTSLTSVTGLSGIETIAPSAFSGCTNLASTYVVKSGTVTGDVTYTLTVTNPATMAMKLVIKNNSSVGVEMPDYDDNNKAPWSGYAQYITEVEFADTFNMYSGSFDYLGSLRIGANSFKDCTSLSKVTLNSQGIIDSLTIGDYAFYNCPSLESVPYATEYGYVTIGNYAFYGCTEFKGFSSSSGSGLGTCKIGDYAFANCTSLNTLISKAFVLEGVSLSVGKGAFKDCTALTSVYTVYDRYGNSTDSVSISDESFSGCSSLTTAYLGSYNSGNTGISAYEGCSSLTTVTIPSGMTTIPYAMFKDCTGLTTVSGSENVTSVADEAFYGCSSLLTYTAGESLTGEINSFKGTQLSDLTYSFKTGTVDGNLSYKLDITNVNDTEMTLTISDTGALAANAKDYLEAEWIPYITKVVIEDGVTAIGGGAFSACTSLTSVVIPESVELGRVADTAFDGCTLTDIDYTIASGSCNKKVSYVIKASKLDGTDQTVIISGNGQSQSYSNSSKQPWANNQQLITSVVVEEGVTSVGAYMFADCVNLTSVTLADSVNTIGSYAFANCTALKAITIPDGVQEIPMGAFTGCTSLTDVTITDDVCIIGNEAFKDCTSLVTITLPSSLESIGNSTFENCTSLETVVVNDSLTSIGRDAFKNCANLTTLDVSEKATVDETAFDGCTSLKGVKYEVIAGKCGEDMTYTLMITEPATNTMTLYINGSGAMYDYDSAEDVPWLKYADQITAVEFTDNAEDAQFITGVGAYAFNGLYGLTSVTLPTHDGFAFTVGDYAFADCTNLSEVSGYITTVGAGAFENCTALTSISIDESLPVGDDAFANCTSLTGITYTVAEGDSGSASYNLVCTNPSERTMVLTISGKGAMADYTHSTTPWSKYSEDIVEIIIEDGVTTVGSKAFSACTNLVTISIPATVSQVNDGDVNTTSLENVTYVVQNETSCAKTNKGSAKYTITSDQLDKTNQKLVITGTGATKAVGWGDSTNYITKVEVAKGITQIAGEMFKDCTALEDVELPSGITAINDNAFQGCTALESIDLPSGVYIASEGFKGCTALKTITIPNGATVAESAFEGCSGLTEVTLLNSQQTIKDKTFKDCTSLTTVNFSDGLTTIGEEAFMNCISLTSLTIPSSVTSIGESSLSGCTGLTEVVIPETLNVGKNLLSGCTALTSVRYNHYEGSEVNIGVADDVLKSINVITDDRIKLAIETGSLDNENTVEFDIKVDTNSFGGDDALYLDGVKVVINEKEYAISECYEEDNYIIFPVRVTVNNPDIASLAIRGQVDAKNSADETVTLYFATVAENVER